MERGARVYRMKKITVTVSLMLFLVISTPCTIQSQNQTVDLITLANGTVVDSRIPAGAIDLVFRHFNAIENRDLAAFRATLAREDRVDTHHQMGLIQSYFGDILGIDSDVLRHAISTAEGLQEIEYLIFYAEPPPARSKHSGMFVKEIRRADEVFLGHLNVVITCYESINGRTYMLATSSWGDNLWFVNGHWGPLTNK